MKHASTIHEPRLPKKKNMQTSNIKLVLKSNLNANNSNFIMQIQNEGLELNLCIDSVSICDLEFLVQHKKLIEADLW